MTHVVIFNQAHRFFFILPVDLYHYTKEVMARAFPDKVYTDLFTGTKEQCEKYGADRKLTILE